MARLLPLALSARSKRPIQILGPGGPIILHWKNPPFWCAELYLDLTHLAFSLLHLSSRLCSRTGTAPSTDKPPMSINLRNTKGLAVPLCPRGIGPVHEARQYGHACLDQRRAELKGQTRRLSHGCFEIIMMVINYCASHTSLSGFWLNPLHVNEWIKPMGVPDYCHGGLCVQAIDLLLAPIGPS